LSQYSQRRPIVQVRSHAHQYLNSEASFTAKGVKWLESKNIYILAVFMAFFLYQCDRLYDLRRLFQELRGTAWQMSRGLTTSNDPNVYVDSEWIFGLAAIILSLVIASKRVFAKRVSPFVAENQEELEEVVLKQRLVGA
jgi:hypothetical protein